MSKKLFFSLTSYLLIMIGFWSWFVLGAFYLKTKDKPTVKVQTIENTPDKQTEPIKNIAVITSNPTQENSVLAQPTLTSEPNQISPSPTQASGSGIPKIFVIEKLNINAQVELVGLNPNGDMDVPSTYETIAWYKLGYKVGNRGSAVLSGHYDNAQGKPAVFWDIKNLTEGDIVKVVDTSDVTYSYKVTSIEEYPYESLPLERIFASNNDYMLNLITCSGTWDKLSRNYSTRTVVYSQLIK